MAHRGYAPPERFDLGISLSFVHQIDPIFGPVERPSAQERLAIAVELSPFGCSLDSGCDATRELYALAGASKVSISSRYKIKVRGRVAPGNWLPEAPTDPYVHF